MRTTERIELRDGYAMQLYDTGYKKLVGPEKISTFVYADGKVPMEEFQRVCEEYVACREIIRKEHMYPDSVTRDFVKGNLKLLQNPQDMTPKELGDAITFCEGYDNSFTRELLSRCGLLEAFAEADTAKARREIMQKAANHFHFSFIC